MSRLGCRFRARHRITEQRSTSQGAVSPTLRALSRRCFCAGRLRSAIVRAAVSHRMKIDSKRIDLPTVHLAHGKHCAARDDSVAGLRQSSKNTEDVAAERRRIVFGNVQAETLVELAEVRASWNESLARARLHRSVTV